MAFKVNNKQAHTDDGIPFLWGSGDFSSAPSNQIKITASDAAAIDYFGVSVAVGSGRVVVGADQDDDNGTDSGSAYIFDLNGTQLAKIKPSDGAAADYFGTSVAVGCGRIVVGSFGDDDNGSASGSAYIFDLNGTQLAKIKPSDGFSLDFFGARVAIGCGRIVVGAYGDDDNGTDSGSAYIFDLNGTQLAKIKASDGALNDYFGISLAVGSGRIVVGAYGDDDNGSQSGSAYIFDLNGIQLAKIKASDGYFGDEFGSSVAVGSGRIVVGSRNDGDDGLFESGSAYIFNLNGTQLAKIKAFDGADEDQFGYSVSVGSGRIVVGARKDDDNYDDSGSAYIFNLNGVLIGKLNASDANNSDEFGISIAVGSGKIVVGAWTDSGIVAASGSAYIFTTPQIYTPYDVADMNSFGV